MALVVNTNLQSMNAQRNLSMSGVDYAKALSRLSSGQRINSAADDAAGLAIATRLGSQVRGLNQAVRNANDGAAMLQTAEGALAEISNIVTRIKELAVQSENGSNSSSDRSSLNSEVSALISEVTRIASQTKFGSTALLDGSFSASFQVGAEVGQTVSTSVSNYKASALSASVASQALTFNAAVTSVGAADANTFAGLATSTALQLAGPDGTAYIRTTASSDDTASYLEGSKSAIAVAKAVNESTSTTGVSASVTSATFTDAGSWANDIDIDGSTNILLVNGQAVVVNLNAGVEADNKQLLVDAVNGQVSGVTAAISSGDVVLTASDGRNISIKATGTGANTVGGEVFGFTTAVSTEKVVARGGVTLKAGGSITSTFSSAATVSGEGTTSASSTTLSSVGVDTAANANTAMIVADALLDTISSARGSLGALQNRLVSTIANLSVVAEKVTDAKSRILDADFATETAALTRAQILQQAGLAILSQANAAPQSVLKLLQ